MKTEHLRHFFRSLVHTYSSIQKTELQIGLHTNKNKLHNKNIVINFLFTARSARTTKLYRFERAFPGKPVGLCFIELFRQIATTRQCDKPNRLQSRANTVDQANERTTAAVKSPNRPVVSTKLRMQSRIETTINIRKRNIQASGSA